MSFTIDTAKFSSIINLRMSNTLSGATFENMSERFNYTLKDSDNEFVFDRAVMASSIPMIGAGSVDIDLYDLDALDIGNGPGRDTIGLTMANATIHAMLIQNKSTSTGDLTVDTNQTGGWTSWLPAGTHSLAPGSLLSGVWPSGIAVADTTNHILRLTSSDVLSFDLYFVAKQ